MKETPLSSTATAPMRSSLACVVVVVDPDDTLVTLPVLLVLLSSRLDATRPENSRALMAFAVTAAENATVMVLPLTSAVATRAEQRTLRAPLVPEPFVTSTSLV